MSAELDPEGEGEQETGPASRKYDRKVQYDDLQQQASAFESDLSAYVEPWVAFSKKLVRSRILLGWVFFVLSIAAGVFIYMETDWTPWRAFIGAFAPLGFALWTGYVQKEARTSGRGFVNSQGLPHDRLQLSMVLTEVRRTLEGARDLGRKGMGDHRAESLLADLADLCTVRMKALLFHQKKASREGKLKEICDHMIKNARITAPAVPLALVILALAVLVPPFVFWNVSAPWMTFEFALMLTGLALAGFFTSLLPVFMVLGFVRRVQRELIETLQSGWGIEPYAFDSTDSITDEFERILKERHEFQQALHNRRHTERGLAVPPERRKLAFPVPTLPSAGKEPS